MRVKLQNNLQPHEQAAQNVVIYDDVGNPIFVALQLTEGVVYSDVREKDFHLLLKAAGVDKTVTVTTLQPKPSDNLIWTP